MKRRVLSKTALFHALFIKKEKSPKRCRFERHYNLFSSPGRAENRGRRRFCSPVFSDISPLPLSPKTQKDADPSTPTCLNTDQWPTKDEKAEGTSPQVAPVHPTLSPDRTKAGHFHCPSLPINTEADKRHKKKQREEERKKKRGRETEEEKEKKKKQSRKKKKKTGEGRKRRREREQKRIGGRPKKKNKRRKEEGGERARRKWKQNKKGENKIGDRGG
jgi:hypothetical protein